MEYNYCSNLQEDNDQDFSDLIYKRYREMREESLEIICECEQ